MFEINQITTKYSYEKYQIIIDNVLDVISCPIDIDIIRLLNLPAYKDLSRAFDDICYDLNEDNMFVKCIIRIIEKIPTFNFKEQSLKNLKPFIELLVKKYAQVIIYGKNEMLHHNSMDTTKEMKEKYLHILSKIIIKGDIMKYDENDVKYIFNIILDMCNNYDNLKKNDNNGDSNVSNLIIILDYFQKYNLDLDYIIQKLKLNNNSISELDKPKTDNHHIDFTKKLDFEQNSNIATKLENSNGKKLMVKIIVDDKEIFIEANTIEVKPQN